MTVSGSSSAGAAVLPTQNQLYAFFVLLCGHHSIRKLPKAIAVLLDEDDVSRALRLQMESTLRDIPVSDVASMDREMNLAAEAPVVHASSSGTTTGVTPLASMRTVRVEGTPPGTLVHLGTRAAVVWLTLLQHCPLMEVLDMSNWTNLFAVDAYQQGPKGNDVIEVLCTLVEGHPSLRQVDLRGQPIGTVGGRRLLESARRNKRLTEITLDQGANELIDRIVVAQLRQQLERNRAAIDAGLVARYGPLPQSLRPEMAAMAFVDRKVARERQALRNLLVDIEAFRECNPTEMDAFVDHADIISIETAVKDSAGVRGDREHLFVIESGAIDVFIGNVPFTMRRGGYFGHQYESVMYSAGMITEKERGRVFRIPLICCSAVLARWEAAVAEFFPALKACVVLQSAHVWMLLRACHTAHRAEFELGDVVIAEKIPFAGIHVVEEGTFVSAPRERHQNIVASPAPSSPTRGVSKLLQTNSKRLEILDQFNAGEELLLAQKLLLKASSSLSVSSGDVPADRSKRISVMGNSARDAKVATLHKAVAAKTSHVFTTGDLFGEEPLVMRRVQTHVTEFTALGSARNRCVVLHLEGAADIVALLRHALHVLTRGYTLALDS